MRFVIGFMIFNILLSILRYSNLEVSGKGECWVLYVFDEYYWEDGFLWKLWKLYIIYYKYYYIFLNFLR